MAVGARAQTAPVDRTLLPLADPTYPAITELDVHKVVKIGPLPVDVFGQKWNLQFQVTPVIPKLIKGHLFEF